MNAGRPRGRSGWRRFPATTAYGVSGSASRAARQASTGSPLVRPQPREAEVELHDRDLGIELRELLEPVERAVRPLGERRAHLRLERVVLGEERARRREVPARVERRATRHGLAPPGPSGSRARTRAEAFPRGARGGRARRRTGRVAVRREDRGGDDRDGGYGDGSDEERDTTLRGHRRTIARAPKL